MDDKLNILLVTTGGTIESFYNPQEGTPNIVPLERQSCIPKALSSIAEARRMMQAGDVTAVQLTRAVLDRIDSGHASGTDFGEPKYDHYPLCMEDSKDVTLDHLKHLAHYIHEHNEYDSIIVVHGTDTIPIHGRKLRELLAEYDVELGAGGRLEKKVIFVGAMEPLRDKHKEWSPKADGWEHLSLAFEAANDPSIAPDTYFTYQNQLLKSSEWNKHREVDEATNTVVDAGFVERESPGQDERRAGHIWQ